MKQRSIISSLAKRTVAGMLCLWLLSMAVLTLVLAGSIQARTTAFYTSELEQALAGLQEGFRAEPVSAAELDFSLPQRDFYPVNGFPLLRIRAVSLRRGTLSMNVRGAINRSEGFDLTGAVIGNVGLLITEGRLGVSNMSDTVSQLGMKVASSQLGFFLTFLDDPVRSGSFPSAEYSGNYAGEPAQASSPMTPTNFTAAEILDGMDSGELHFDSARLRQSAVLRGRWLTDGAGEKRCFVVAAYGWSPLLEAVYQLAHVYILAFAVFQLVGLAVWLGLRRSIVRPLKSLERAMGAEPLSVSKSEYDYRMPYGELRGPIAAYLLRRQMMQAVAAVSSIPNRPAEECPLLLTELQSAEGKLLPILMDRGLKINRELKADGRINASRDQAEDILLALFRETVDYALQGEKMTIRTLERAGFLLAEIEVRSKLHVSDLPYERLWDGVYRSPADGDAPGAKLRKAMWRLPGSFATVRKTKRGLALTLGLPKKSESPNRG